MSKAKKAGIASITTIILAIIGVFASGGNFTFDFSSSTTGDSNTDNSQITTDNSQTTIINQGDTIIHEAAETFVDDIFDDLIDRGYDYYCEEVDPDSEECDWYWD